jgi:catechol 2,3-dioxygenase
MTMPATSLSYALTRPAYIHHSHLIVHDLDLVSSYYQKVIGLAVLEQSASGAVLGVGGLPLLTLTVNKDTVRAPRSAPGLFHTAFLMPDRAALARWLVNAVAQRAPIDGASDHIVSEAIYLTDPEGNGIEVYADRKPDDWVFAADGQVNMATLPLDLQGLYDSASREPWTGAPEGTAIGHIHLQVSHIPQADAFFTDILGMQKMVGLPSAGFYATGKYHHHIGANIWNSRGAAPRTAQMTGLSDYTLHYNDPAKLATTLATLDRMQIPVDRNGNAVSFSDPWGITVKLVA